MQSEDFDKRIAEAAAHHRPVYQEKDWAAMKKLLDQHLPEKKDTRRRFLLLLLLLLGIGTGAWFILGRPGMKPSAGMTAEQPVPAGQQPGGPTVPGGQDSKPVPGTGKDAGTSSIPSTENGPAVATTSSPDAKETSNTTNQTINHKTSSGPNTNNRQTPGIASRPSGPGSNLLATTGGGNTKRKNNNGQPGSNKNAAALFPVTAVESNTTSTPVSKPATGDKKEPANTSAVAQNNTGSPATPAMAAVAPAVETHPEKTPEKKEPAKPAATAKAKNKSPLKKSFGLAFTLSAGPDLSAVGVDKLGKVKPVYGAGLSLTYGKHFSINTGYYTANKVYKAEAADYKFPTRPYHYNYLYEIDANCRVVEIPLSLSWNFREKNRGNWFVSAGASSFLMKRETYEYLYKYPSGQVTTYTKRFGNKNKHIFSVLSLSGGYKYQLSKSVFVAAEPYLKIPTTGVGAGKLHLNSGGVLFTVGIRPF